MNGLNFLEKIIEMLPDPFYAIDCDGKVVLWNASMEKLTKVAKKDIIGQSDYSHSIIFYGHKRPTLAELVLKSDEEAEKFYYRFNRNPDGSVEGETYSPKMDYHYWGKAVPIFEDDGKIIYVLVLSKDVSFIKGIQEQQEELLKRYEALFMNSPDGILCIDENHIIFDVNESFLKIFGYTRDECIGRDPDDLVMPLHLKPKAKEMTNILFEKFMVDFEDLRYTKKGMPLIVNVRGIIIRSGDKLIGGFAIYTDVTEKTKNKEKLESTNKELEATIKQLMESKEELRAQYEEIQKYAEKVEYLAVHDPQTMIYNRLKLSEIALTEINENKRGALILFDLDDFKTINDIFGHAYGDEILKQIAGNMKCMESDKSIIFRHGGDEFLILLREEDPEKIREHVEKIRNCLRENVIVDSVGNRITATMGIVRYPHDGESIDELLIKVDIALGNAKKSGKDRYFFFNEKMMKSFNTRINIENMLRRALENEEFTILYQPIIKTETGKVTSFEALLRIKGSNISPDEFIPVAEDSGFILPLGKWVLKEAIKQIRTWMDIGLQPPPISVNLSPKHFYDVHIDEYITDTLTEFDVPSHLLEIEITENIFAENRYETISILNRLKEKGIIVSLDDFGTGYSSLNYLTFMPLDKIKLDKSLMVRLIRSDSVMVLESLVALAHGLNLEVVTEGIETKDEFIKMKNAGSDYLQGFLFSKPIAFDEAEKLFNKNLLGFIYQG
ncbi:MAG: EAL domain-containing protein [Clostridiales bacterium]|nr:EAL domain-containing protein [Clostridiales bacterium]